MSPSSLCTASGTRPPAGGSSLPSWRQAATALGRSTCHARVCKRCTPPRTSSTTRLLCKPSHRLRHTVRPRHLWHAPRRLFAGGYTAVPAVELAYASIAAVVSLSSIVLSSGLTPFEFRRCSGTADALVPSCLLGDMTVVVAARIDCRSQDAQYQALLETFAADADEATWQQHLQSGLHCDEPLSALLEKIAYHSELLRQRAARIHSARQRPRCAAGCARLVHCGRGDGQQDAGASRRVGAHADAHSAAHHRAAAAEDGRQRQSGGGGMTSRRVTVHSSGASHAACLAIHQREAD